MNFSWRALIVLGSVLTLVSISGFFFTYSFLEKNKETVEIGRSILFPAPYDFNFLSSPGLRTIAYFFIALVILLIGLLVIGLLGLILLLMGIRRRSLKKQRTI